MLAFKKPLSEDEMLRELCQLSWKIPLVEIIVEATKHRIPNDPTNLDAIVEIRWENLAYRFAAELKPRSTPIELEATVARIKRSSGKANLNPLVVAPFLSEKKLEMLAREGVSGLDLCGNAVLTVPGELLVWRSGNLNSYPNGNPIQNVFRGTSSLVSRTFLLQPQFESAQELGTFVQDRAGEVTPATVSKVCSVLADELIIERRKVGRATPLRLLQPDKLIDALAANFQPPEIKQRFVGKCSLAPAALTAELQAWQKKMPRERVSQTGADSVGAYAVMAREPVKRLYCTNLKSLVRFLGTALTETSRFPSIELLETRDPTAYFDVRDNLISSPIQSYLELQQGDKRDREISDQVRRRLLLDLPKEFRAQ